MGSLYIELASDASSSRQLYPIFFLCRVGAAQSLLGPGVPSAASFSSTSVTSPETLPSPRVPKRW